MLVDHFDAIINKIDIRVETLLVHSQTDKERHDMNEIREKQIVAVKEFQEESLSNISTLDEKDYESKFAHILNDASLTHARVAEAILCEIIETDLMLVDEANSKTKQALCILPVLLSTNDKTMIR